MKDKLLIIGAGGHGKVIADIAKKINKWKEVSFLDDDISKKEVLGCLVIGKLIEIKKYTECYDFFIGLGDNSLREKKQIELEQLNSTFATLIHPQAIIGSNVEIGPGSVIMAGVVINCCSIIGKSCIINTGATIDHDNEIGDYVHISPGVNTGGSVKIGNSTWICIGAKIKNNITIIDNVIIGAGAVVIKDILEKGTYIGIPAEKK